MSSSVVVSEWLSGIDSIIIWQVECGCGGMSSSDDGGWWVVRGSEWKKLRDASPRLCSGRKRHFKLTARATWRPERTGNDNKPRSKGRCSDSVDVKVDVVVNGHKEGWMFPGWLCRKWQCAVEQQRRQELQQRKGKRLFRSLAGIPANSPPSVRHARNATAGNLEVQNQNCVAGGPCEAGEAGELE